MKHLGSLLDRRKAALGACLVAFIAASVVILRGSERAIAQAERRGGGSASETAQHESGEPFRLDGSWKLAPASWEPVESEPEPEPVDESAAERGRRWRNLDIAVQRR